jgi:sterol desaturase/sphingolipid hydroxylase (fatty acid hydroxylase superfamily)
MAELGLLGLFSPLEHRKFFFTPDKNWIGVNQANSISHIERNIKVGTILMVLLILMMLGALPAWLHSKRWGYYPSGGLGLVVVIVIVLMLLGKI